MQAQYSPAVSSLLKLMLSKDPNLRPTIHQILKTPVIEKRIQRFLQEDTFKAEFAHGLLHNQNVFEEFKKLQLEKSR